MNVIRKCDSRCHNAKGKVCKCWCGGAFHGIGEERASMLYSARELEDEWEDDYYEGQGVDFLKKGVFVHKEEKAILDKPIPNLGG